MSSILRIYVEQGKNAWSKSGDRFFTSIPVVAILFYLFSIIISSAVRIYSSSDDFTVKLYTIFAFIALSQAFMVLLNMNVKTQKIMALNRVLQGIVDSEGLGLSI